MAFLFALLGALLQVLELAHLLDGDARLLIPDRPYAPYLPSEDVGTVGEP